MISGVALIFTLHLVTGMFSALHLNPHMLQVV
jgi:hypothetical protein